jgi:hypothetical protein
MSRTGRNELCPCGSGKKYKRCCLGKETWRDEFTRELTAHGLPLLRELGRFAAQRTGAPPEAIAAERFPFWRPPLDKQRGARLLDYLIFDHRVSGRSAIQEYLAERGPIVTPQWRALLEVWETASMRLYVLEGWSGGFARCRPALPGDGQAIDVMPLEADEARIQAQSPVALRALPLAAGFIYAAWPTTFGSRGVDDLIAAAVARHHAFVRSERIVSVEEFLRLAGTTFDEEAAGPAPSSIILPGRV